MSNSGELVTVGKEKAEILNNFVSVFTGNPSPHGSHLDSPQDGEQGDKIPSTISKDKVHDCLKNLRIYMSMGPDEMHRRL